MFENKIEFLAQEPILSDKLIQPEPSVVNIPKWYKNLDNYITKELKDRTIKLCMPFLDALTAGYVLKHSCDITINQQVVNPKFPEEGESMWLIEPTNSAWLDAVLKFGAKTNRDDYHPIEQLGGETGGCPYIKQNHNQPFLKLINPWIIKTPPGYSCLFLPIINQQNENFTPICGVVDTDNFYSPVNFPIILHKKGTFEIKKGDPIVTVIPFKRDNWKMELKKQEEEKVKKFTWYQVSNYLNIYKRFYRTKKSWK